MDEVAITLKIMAEVLDKKIGTLQRLETITREQSECINTDEDRYFELVKEKQPLVEEIISIDHTFQAMFLRIKNGLRDVHAEAVDVLKEKVKVITDYDVAIKTLEMRNKNTANASLQRISLPKANKKHAMNAYMRQIKK